MNDQFWARKLAAEVKTPWRLEHNENGYNVFNADDVLIATVSKTGDAEADKAVAVAVVNSVAWACLGASYGPMNRAVIEATRQLHDTVLNGMKHQVACMESIKRYIAPKNTNAQNSGSD